tara:strand:- start:169 stop:630 length:462 start_codon:yes stop_codon:yes gene_type:complete
MKITKNVLRKVIQESLQQEVQITDAKCPVGNRVHKKDGTWGSADDSGSWSIKKKSGCPDGGQHKYTNGKKAGNREPCGRINRKKLCREEMVDSVDDNISQTYNRERLEALIRDTIKDELGKMSKGKGGCSWNQIIRGMNKLDRARSGDLYKKD